ncbi:MAG: ROK family protein [Ardenticatenia bacterium]|nr:ROK family protein [Ardenticatenia bacterium]
MGELLAEGVVEELGTAPSPGGKPPILVGVADNSRLILAVDVSNDEYRGALVNLRGKIAEEMVRPVGRLQGQEALEAAYTLAGELLAKSPVPLLGIGISTPGLVDPQEGVVYQAVNRGWVDVPLRALFAERYGLPVFVANDSHMMALAEASFGSGRGRRRLVAIKVGEGIGTGIVVDGQLYLGDGFGAGEIGHLVVVDEGLPCRCGNRGCLETVAGVRAIQQRTEEEARRFPESALAAALDRFPSSIEALGEAARQGDPTALALVHTIGRHLGIGVAALVSVLNIERIVIHGPVRHLGPPLLQAIGAEARRRALERLVRATRIEFSQLGEKAALLGASALLSSVLGLP